MTSLKTALSTIGERAKAATEGPWKHMGSKVIAPFDSVASSVYKEDAAFIAAARTDVPKLLAVIDKLIPNFATDLNAIATIEAKLTDEQWDRYETEVMHSPLTGSDSIVRDLLSLTALQRATLLCKVLCPN